MININCQGKIFSINSQTIQKIPVIQKMIDNKEFFNTNNDDQLFLQLDPLYFQLLINFLTISGFVVPCKYKNNFITIANMYLLKTPWINHHQSHILTDKNTIEFKDIYNINDIFITMLGESFETINFKKGFKSPKIDVCSVPNIAHTKISINDKQMFNNVPCNDLTPNLCIWKRNNNVIDNTHYDSDNNVINMASMYGYFSLSDKFVNIINQQLVLKPVNTLTISFDDFKQNHVAFVVVEINYDSINC